MSTTFSVATDLTTINCGKCGGVYAINERFRREQWECGGGWHCPYCETSWGYWESENEKLKKQLEQERKAGESRLAAERAKHDQTREALKHTEARRRAEKANNTKMKKRIAGGVCPCCRRTFQNLSAHMKNQHPAFAHEVPCNPPSP